MNDEMKPGAPGQVSCEVCMKQVPHSEATSAEAQDYTLYFCGLECYAKWQEEGEKERENHNK